MIARAPALVSPTQFPFRGKGVPGSVAGHPLLFVTLTSPSFGPVHTPGPTLCRARRDPAEKHCEHDRRITCTRRHGEDDPALGRPLCPDCFEYAGAVLWNGVAGELWRRTTFQIRRELARLVGVSQRTLGRLVSVQYVKVAEFQRRAWSTSTPSSASTPHHNHPFRRSASPGGSPTSRWCLAGTARRAGGR